MSAIQWTDQTWNPTVGCSRVSPGCDNCYAEKVAARGMQDAHRGLTEGGKWTGEVRCLPDRLDTPLRWRKPRRVFVDSMSDLFHPDVPEDFIAQVWDVMARTPQHTYQVLTKRPQRMAAVLPNVRTPDGVSALLPNVWLGASIESSRYTFRAEAVRDTPAAVRFLSLEPLLGSLLPSLDLDGIDWVILGGESGPGARPMDLHWVREIIDLCLERHVAVFVKQLGSVVAKECGFTDRKGGDPSEWPDDLRVREYPEAAS